MSSDICAFIRLEFQEFDMTDDVIVNAIYLAYDVMLDVPLLSTRPRYRGGWLVESWVKMSGPKEESVMRLARRKLHLSSQSWSSTASLQALSTGS